LKLSYNLVMKPKQIRISSLSHDYLRCVAAKWCMSMQEAADIIIQEKAKDEIPKELLKAGKLTRGK